MQERPKLIGYLRVSTGEQARSGVGLAAQRRTIRAAAKAHDWDLIEVVADEGQSGKDLDRPELRAALERIAAGEADGLVAAKLDRLTRSVLHFATLLGWFDRAQATLIALDLGIDTSTPGGRLVANVFASVAEWERDTIAARTKDGLAAMRAEGKAISRSAVEDQPDLKIRIVTMRADGFTYQAIADVLNEEGVPTLRGAPAWRVSAVQSAAGYKRPPSRPRDPDLPALGRSRTSKSPQSRAPS